MCRTLIEVTFFDYSVTSAHCFCSYRKATRLALECLKRRYLGVRHCARKPHSPATARTSHVLAVLTHSIIPRRQAYNADQ